MRLTEFIIAATIAEITPGPNMGYLAALALAEGRRVGLAAVAGVTLGLALLGVIAAFGLGLLLERVPGAAHVLRWGGIAFLLWLAWDTWRGEAENSAGEMAESFRRGLIVNLLNPKAAAFYVTVLPIFLDAPPALGDTLLLTVVYVGIATLVHAGVVLGAASFRSFAADQRRLTLFRRAGAVSLAVVALWFAWATRA